MHDEEAKTQATSDFPEMEAVQELQVSNFV